MDPFRFCLAVGPFAMYLFVLGYVNLRRRPLVTTGSRDMALLGFACFGFVLVGPMELFRPEAAALKFGGFVWLMLIVFYALCVALVILLARPRLVIYNFTGDQIRSTLASLVDSLDDQARWAGDNLVLPQLGVQVHMEYFRPMRNVVLASTGPRQHLEGWQRLDDALREALASEKVPSNPRGFSFLTLGVLLCGLAAFRVINDHDFVLRTFDQMLRM